MTVAYDIDGTLLNYGGGEFQLNQALVNTIPSKSQIDLITNQGGIPFFLMGVANMPSPQQFYHRFCRLRDELLMRRIYVAGLQVSLWHPKATDRAIQNAARQLRENFQEMYWPPFTHTFYTTARARKPQPFMLHHAGCTIYYGDSDEDRFAAEAADAQFIHVPRFGG